MSIFQYIALGLILISIVMLVIGFKHNSFNKNTITLHALTITINIFTYNYERIYLYFQ